jgi:hypothetical protein
MLLKSSYHELPARRRLKTYPSQLWNGLDQRNPRTPYEADYFHYLAWSAEPFNINVLQHFHQKIMITSITYTIAIHYYMHYLAKKSRTRRKPREM